MRVKPPPAVVVRVLTKGDSSLVAPVCFPLPSAPRLPRSWYMPGAEPADTHLLLSVRLAARNAAASALAAWNDLPLAAVAGHHHRGVGLVGQAEGPDD